jgi:hypothetical protein
MSKLIVITFGVLIILSYKPKKEKVIISKVEHIYKLTKVDAG